MSTPALTQDEIDELTKPLVEFTELLNPHFTVLVMQFALGQFRIQLTDKRQPDSDAPAGHGSIVQECCTYQFETLTCAVTMLRFSDDPLAEARSWARPWNCEYAGGRIRLDSQPREANQGAPAEALRGTPPAQGLDGEIADDGFGAVIEFYNTYCARRENS